MAGKAISKANMARIQSIYDHAVAMGARTSNTSKDLASKALEQGIFDRISAVRHAIYTTISVAEAEEHYPYLEDIYDGYAIIELSDLYFRANYLIAPDGSATMEPRDKWVQVQEVWVPVDGTAKGINIPTEDVPDYTTSIKALGDRNIELRVAWGWDGHKERFLKGVTDFDVENFPTPPICYYHGFSANGKKNNKPVYVGKTISREDRADGHYITAKLNNKPEADLVWNAALAGKAFASPGTVGHLIRKQPDGTLTYWPIAEMSTWDGAPSRKQAHPSSMAFPVLKALYQEAEIPLPQKAEGDSAEVDSIDFETIKTVLAERIVQTMRDMNKGS